MVYLFAILVDLIKNSEKGKTYYRRVKKPEEYDEDDEWFTEDELRRMLDYYLKPLAETKQEKTC